MSAQPSPIPPTTGWLQVEIERAHYAKPQGIERAMRTARAHIKASCGIITIDATLDSLQMIYNATHLPLHEDPPSVFRAMHENIPADIRRDTAIILTRIARALDPDAEEPQIGGDE